MIFPLLEAAVTKYVDSRVNLKQKTWVNRRLITDAHSQWNFDFQEPEGPIPQFFISVHPTQYVVDGCPRGIVLLLLFDFWGSVCQINLETEMNAETAVFLNLSWLLSAFPLIK